MKQNYIKMEDGVKAVEIDEADFVAITKEGIEQGHLNIVDGRI